MARTCSVLSRKVFAQQLPRHWRSVCFCLPTNTQNNDSWHVPKRRFSKQKLPLFLEKVWMLLHKFCEIQFSTFQHINALTHLLELRFHQKIKPKLKRREHKKLTTASAAMGKAIALSLALCWIATLAQHGDSAAPKIRRDYWKIPISSKLQSHHKNGKNNWWYLVFFLAAKNFLRKL